ncbi:GNAT family N-acetyltransferase [Nocardia vinacea]|uniref:GNAT family N-acetyltransferase n=1 Tax=Nocardia vinacea TaxID=96468 RepID=UPI00344A0786
MTKRETRRARARRQNMEARQQQALVPRSPQTPIPQSPRNLDGNVQIRPCRAADLPAAGALLTQLDDVVLEEWVGAAVQADRFGQGLPLVYGDNRSGLFALIQRAWNRAMDADTFLKMCVPSGMLLVADHPDQGVVGALLAYPPASVIMQATQTAAMVGYSADEVMHTMRTGLTETVRIKALVVQKDQRGKGIGAALLDHCVQTYDTAGFRLIYGQLVTAERLAPYYSSQGFTVLEPDEGVRLDRVFGVNFGFGPGPGEQLFARWHGNAPTGWRVSTSRSR